MKTASFSKIILATLGALPCFLTPTLADSTPRPMNSPLAPRKSWVKLDVQTDRASYTPGTPIQVSLTATNISKNVAYLKFRSGQRFDLRLFQEGKSEAVYSWSANKMFLQALGQIVLKPGQSESFETQIGDEMGQLQPGKYRLEAFLTNSSRITAQPVSFEIVAPRAGVTATTDKTKYKIGEPVVVKFKAQNLTDKPQTFEFGSGQNYDVAVKNEGGQSIWNWAANLRFIMVSRPVTFAPREIKEFEVTWDGRALPDYEVKPGTYFVQAFYASNPPIYAEPISIQIEE